MDPIAESATTTTPPTLDSIAERLTRLEARVESQPQPDRLSMVVFSGELDKLLAAFVIATGAAACDTRVSMFFTFWGTAALKKTGPQIGDKSLVERAFGWMLPGGLHRRKLSRLDMLGVGRRLMGREMRKKKAPSLDELVELARELEVEICVCEMSMSLMGIRREELIDYPDMGTCGVARFLDVSAQAGTTLFI